MCQLDPVGPGSRGLGRVPRRCAWQALAAVTANKWMENGDASDPA